jgi:hypothetical protein
MPVSPADIDGPLERLREVAAPRYLERCRRALALLGPMCGLDAARLEEQFGWCHERLAAADQGEGGPAAAAKLLGISLSNLYLFDFVLGPTDGAAGLALSTAAKRGKTLFAQVTNTFGAALRLLLDSQAPKETGLALADIFRLAFPDPAALVHCDPVLDACSLRLTMQPGGFGLALVVDPGVARRESLVDGIEAIGARLGLAEQSQRALRALRDSCEYMVDVKCGVDCGARRLELRQRQLGEGALATASEFARAAGLAPELSQRLASDARELAVALGPANLAAGCVRVVHVAHDEPLRLGVALRVLDKAPAFGAKEAVANWLRGRGRDPASVVNLLEALEAQLKLGKPETPLHSIELDYQADGTHCIRMFAQPGM